MGNIDTKIWESQLQQLGGRITKPRKAILNVIAASAQPLTPLEIFDLARKDAPNIGIVTVYRTIEKMESLGMIDRIHGPNQCRTVFRAASGHRHLLSCTSCGRSVYFEGFTTESEFNKIGRKNGFVINGHLLQLFGLCESCQDIRQKDIRYKDA